MLSSDDAGVPIQQIGIIVAKRRHVLGLSQQALAERVGVNRRTVSMWERDLQYPHRHLGKLEQVLGMDLTADDPAEAELQASLNRLYESGLIEAEDVERQMASYRERKRRAAAYGSGGRRERAS